MPSSAMQASFVLRTETATAQGLKRIRPPMVGGRIAISADVVLNGAGDLSLWSVSAADQRLGIAGGDDSQTENQHQ